MTLLRACGGVLLLLVVTSVSAFAADVALIDAVKRSDRAGVRARLEQRADVKAPEPDGTTALHWAAHVDEVEIASMLIRAGADVSAANRYGATPLSLASVTGSPAMIALLLESGASANTTNPEGETVLMEASRSGSVDAVKLLLDRGAKVDAPERWRGQTALMWAAAEGHTAVVQLLIARGADVRARSTTGFTALLFAAREGQIEVVDALLRAGADITENLPVRRRGPANAPAPPPEEGMNALLLAIGSAHYELAALLLDKGANPNAAPRGWTALHQITWVRKTGLSGSNNPAPQGSGRLSSLDLVKKLVAAGADVNARVTRRPDMGITNLNAIGASPFLLAARTADAELMRLLHSLGADPMLRNADDSTALMIAAGVGTSSPGEDPGTEPEVLEAVQVTLDLGNDLNAVDKNGETAMHGAAYKALPAVVRLLSDRGAKVEIWNQKNKRGWTPLTIAEGVHRGMNIISSPVTAVAIREVLKTTASSARTQ